MAVISTRIWILICCQETYDIGDDAREQHRLLVFVRTLLSRGQLVSLSTALINVYRLNGFQRSRIVFSSPTRIETDMKCLGCTYHGEIKCPGINLSMSSGSR